jgi:hypothetical protein
MDYVTGEVVCTASAKLKVDLVAEIHDYLSRQFNAVQSFEYNGVGMRFAKGIEDLKTPNPAPRRKPDGSIDIEKTGQYVSIQKKRYTFADLAHSIVTRKIVVHDREFVQQAKLVMRDDYGFPITDPKLSFDWVLMMDGLVQLAKYAPRGTANIRTYVPNEKGEYVPVR